MGGRSIRGGCHGVLPLRSCPRWSGGEKPGLDSDGDCWRRSIPGRARDQSMPDQVRGCSRDNREQSASLKSSAFITSRWCGRNPTQARQPRLVAFQTSLRVPPVSRHQASQPGHSREPQKPGVLFAQPCPPQPPSRTSGSGLHKCDEADHLEWGEVQGSPPDGCGRSGGCRFRGMELFSSPPLCRVKNSPLLQIGSNFTAYVVFGWSFSPVLASFDHLGGFCVKSSDASSAASISGGESLRKAALLAG